MSRNLISPNHFGFVPYRSTSDALISTCYQISSALDAQSSSCAVFINLKKAIDSLSHALLLETLYSFDLPSFLISWLNSYLTGRSQCVRIDTSLSDSLHVFSGVPQGSILSPLLFIISFNDTAFLPLSPSTKLFIYADNVLLLHPANFPADVTSLNLDLRTICFFAVTKSLRINITKSKYMFLSFRAQF